MCETFGLRFPQLVEQLGADNVVAELGGTLAYNHEMWISNRTVSYIQ